MLARSRFAAPAAVALGGLIGLLIVGGATVPLVAAVVAIAAVVALTMSPGWALGVWALAVTNTMPGANLDSLHVPGLFQPYDGLMVVLCVAAAYVAASLPREELRRRLPRWLAVAVVTLVAWWLIALLRTWLYSGIPLRPAALYGRDLLYGGVATACGAVLLRGRPDIFRALHVMMVGAAIYSLVFVPHVVFGLGGGWIVHPYLQAATDGLVRVYQPSNDLVVAVLPVALWLALATRDRRRRLAYGCAAALFALQVALQQTRATYIGVGLSLVVATVFVVARPAYRSLLPRAVALWSVIGVAILALGLVAVSFSGSASALVLSDNAVYRRILSIPDALGTHSSGGASGSWAYRLQLAERLLRLLGHDLLWGMGFLSPAYHYFTALPDGNLRNSDVGALGTVMVIGVIGLVLVVTPFAGSIVCLVRGSATAREDPADAALVVGLVAFLTGALLSSITLVTLFLGSGPAMSGLFAGCAIALSRQAAAGLSESPVAARDGVAP